MISTTSMTHFLSGKSLHEFLNLDDSLEVADLLESSLMGPVRDLFDRPRKDLRAQLVRLGFDLALAQSTNPARSVSQAQLEQWITNCCDIIEILHAGSLIVDDIQDNSQFRRGKETLHRLYGLPIALNAGNWLYFLPSHLIQKMDLPANRKTLLLEACQSTLLLGHYGQALDVGVQIQSLPRERVAKAAYATMELKSGVLVALALKMGSLALESPIDFSSKLDACGRKLGVALQMFDDLGNLRSTRDPAKSCEDIKLKKVGFILALCAEKMSDDELQEFLQFVDSDECAPHAIFERLDSLQIPKCAHEMAVRHLTSVREMMITELKIEIKELERLDKIAQKLAGSYG